MTKFVGREQELQTLHDQLQQNQRVAITAIAGMGGIGKTELALQYAYYHLDLQTYPGGICWLRARQELGTQIVEFARTALNLKPPEDLELDAKVKWCWQNWREGAVLVVLDDVQDYRYIQPFLPAAEPRFRVLLTTRSRVGSPIQKFEIKVLSEEKAIELLRVLVDRDRPDLRGFQNLGGLDTAKQICQWLGYLPLGIELVGRYLAHKLDTSLTTLWQRLQDKRLEAKALKDAESGMTAPLGIAAAFELSWEGLDESAQQLAGLLSLFAPAPIPWTLVEACLPKWDTEDLEDLRDKQLLGLHLLQRPDTGTYQLHQLLHEFFAAKRKQMAAEEEMKQAFCRVMVAEAQQIPQTPTLTLIQQVTPTIPHLKAAATNLKDWLTDADLITPCTGIAWFYQGQAAYDQALPWLEQCHQDAKTRLGANHPDVATALNNLAGLYSDQGRYGEAEPLVHRALAITEQQLGTDHPDVATTLNNLAHLYSAQGRYGEAEPLVHRALAITEQQLGTDHPAVATTLNNLAHLYSAQGRYGEAEPLYLRALAITEQQLGTDHPAVATTLNNLAELYRTQGRYGEAEPLYLRALAILFNRLRADHPNTQTVQQNLRIFIAAVMQAGQTAQLSDHPLTQAVLRQMREGSGG